MNNLQNYYANYDEDSRLVKDKAHQIEFLTTLRFLEPLLKNSRKVLELGAGTGRYSIHLANEKRSVTAQDVVPKHIEVIRDKALQNGKPDQITAILGDATDLTQFPDASFDAVLCMGPLYHLKTVTERQQCLSECLRVLRDGGIFATAYINRFSAAVSSLDIFKSSDTLKNLINSGDGENAFYYSTPGEMESSLTTFPVKRIHHIGSDGIVHVLKEKINAFDDSTFNRWLDFHFQTCEEESLLGYSMHGLWIGKKES